MVRTFICVEINNPELIEQIEVNTAEIRKIQGLRPVRETQMHLTLKFLGEVPEDRIDEISAAIEKIRYDSFDITLHGLGCFPNLNYIKVVWIGITEGREQLIRLSRFIENQLFPLGFPKEKRRFSPHLTLARVKSLGESDKINLKHIIRDSHRAAFGVQKIESFILKKSTLTPDGPIYENLSVVSLR